MNLLLEIEKVVVEGAGAAGIAALLEHPDLLRRPRGRRGAQRRQRRPAAAGLGDHARAWCAPVASPGCTSRSPTCPAALGLVTTTIGEAGGNIVEIGHQRMFLDVLGPRRRARGGGGDARPRPRRAGDRGPGRRRAHRPDRQRDDGIAVDLTHQSMLGMLTMPEDIANRLRSARLGHALMEAVPGAALEVGTGARARRRGRSGRAPGRRGAAVPAPGRRWPRASRGGTMARLRAAPWGWTGVGGRALPPAPRCRPGADLGTGVVAVDERARPPAADGHDPVHPAGRRGGPRRPDACRSR